MKVFRRARERVRECPKRSQGVGSLFVRLRERKEDKKNKQVNNDDDWIVRTRSLYSFIVI